MKKNRSRTRRGRAARAPSGGAVAGAVAEALAARLRDTPLRRRLRRVAALNRAGEAAIERALRDPGVRAEVGRAIESALLAETVEALGQTFAAAGRGEPRAVKLLLDLIAFKDQVRALLEDGAGGAGTSLLEALRERLAGRGGAGENGSPAGRDDATSPIPD